ncbi:MAG: AMP-binding protein, partial [Burkholderiales bacterium]
QTMFYSSGTTGRPKGIKRPVDGSPFGTAGLADKLTGGVFGFSSNDVQLALAPLYHAAPLGWALGAQRMGSTVVVMDRFDPLEALKLIERYKVTHAQWVPTMFVRLLNLPEEERRKYDVSSLRCVVHAAAPCPVDIKRRMIEWFGPKILEYYAGSEGNGFCLVNSQQWLDHPGTVGKPIFGAVHILGDDQEELPQGEIGMIYFGGGAPFQYHKDPEKSRSAVSKQGYSTLGDYGYLDKEGFVYIADRRTDLIISGGVNIYPRETEEALLLHPAVLDVAVIGAPSKDFGQDVVAVVELKQGFEASPALAAELAEFCRSKIAHLKCPKRIDFGALPRTETGKLLRRKLKDKYAAEAAG